MNLTATPLGAQAALLGDDEAERIVVTHAPAEPGKHNDRWLITLDYGWRQTIIAECAYRNHAEGVGEAVAAALDCPLEWLA